MNKLKPFGLKLSEYTRGIKNNKSRFLPFLATTIAALDRAGLTDKELKLFKDFFTESINFFPQISDLLSIYDQVNPNFIFSKVYQLVKEEHLRTKLVDSYLSLFRLRKDQNKSPLSLEQGSLLFQNIAKFPEYFKSRRQEIRTAIEEMFFEYSFLITFDSEEAQKNFITTKTIENFITTINSEDLNLKKKLDLLNVLDHQKILEEIVNKTLELIKQESSLAEREQRVWIAQFLIDFIHKSINELGSIQEVSKIQELSSAIINWYSQSSNWDNKLTYYQAIKLLKNIPNNPISNQLEEHIKNFIEGAPAETFRKLGKATIKEFSKQYLDQLITACINDSQKFSVIVKWLSTSQISLLCMGLLTKSDTIQDITQKSKFFELLEKLKFGKDKSLISQFHSRLISLKPNNLEFVRKYSRKWGLFNREQRLALK